MFGHLTEQVQQVRFNNSYNPLPLDQTSPELAVVFKHIESGAFGDGHIYEPLLSTVCTVSVLSPPRRVLIDTDLRPRLLPRVQRLWVIP